MSRKRLEDLPLTTRCYNSLTRAKGLTYLDEVEQLTTAELLRIPNFGRKSLDDLRKAGVVWDTSNDPNPEDRRYTCSHPGCQVSPFRWSKKRRDPTKCEKHQPKKDWVDGPITMLRDAAAGHNIQKRAISYLKKRGIEL